MIAETLYRKYMNQFRCCFGEPLTEGEIVSRISSGNYSKTGRSVFEQKYLPKLREMALVAVIPRDPENSRLLKKYYNFDWKPMIRRYYIFTPRTAEIERRLRLIIERLYDYLENKDLLRKELDLLLTEIIKYEITFYSRDVKKFGRDITKTEKSKQKDKKTKILKKINRIYLEKYGTLFDYLFNNEMTDTHPESSEHRLIVRSQFAKVLSLINENINFNKIFYKEFED